MSRLAVFFKSWVLTAGVVAGMAMGVAAGVVADECKLKGEKVVLSYQKSIVQQGNKTSSNINVWRNQSRVAIQYLDQNVTELWELIQNKHLLLSKLSNEHKKGIEYETKKLSDDGSNAAWSQKWQLVPDNLISKMTVNKGEDTACGQRQTLSMESDGGQIQLTWITELKIVEKFSVTAGEKLLVLELLDSSNGLEKIDQFFGELSDFQMIDYADIGDSEYDPVVSDLSTLNLVGLIDFGVEGRSDHGHSH